MLRYPLSIRYASKLTALQNQAHFHSTPAVRATQYTFRSYRKKLEKNLKDRRLIEESFENHDLLFKLPRDKLLESEFSSLGTRGFHRAYPSYTPPQNVQTLLDQAHEEVFGSNLNGKTKLDNWPKKFEFLSKCADLTNHWVPNSQLGHLKTVEDVVEFYCTPVKTTTPYDDLVRSTDLPPNLHVQENPLRFHPDTDTLFGGVTAFPGSSTIVTDLAAKKKYKGYKVEPIKWFKS